jgi:hypothetical protein
VAVVVVVVVVVAPVGGDGGAGAGAGASVLVLVRFLRVSQFLRGQGRCLVWAHDRGTRPERLP